MADTPENKSDVHICAALLAHVDAGKTTLSELMLYKRGVIRSLGRVDHGDTFLDTDQMERSRGITIFSKQAELEIGEKKVSLLDTPGHVDFSAEMERCLQVLDYAVLIISAADGVQSHTETLWMLLKQYRIPVFLFVNKMDQPEADRGRVMEQIRQRFGSECIDFSQDKEDRDDAFWESIAMTDEALLEKFLETGRIEETEIAEAVSTRRLFPCYFGSALKDTGVDGLIDGLTQYMRCPSYPQTFGARVFKITRDAMGTRLTHMKVTGGTLRVRTLLSDEAWEKDEKVNQIRIYNGDKYRTVEQVQAGEICAVAGLSDTKPGDGLGIDRLPVRPMLEPVLQFKVDPPPKPDIRTVLSKLRILEEEYPEMHVAWDEQLQELHVQLMGDVQTEVLKNIIRERFDFEVEFSQGDVVYLETIADTVEGVGHFEPLRHYAEVHLLMEPLPRGSGLVFANKCSQDQLSLNWQRLILMHLSEKKHRGVLTGAPITDIKITVAAGRAHNKHTEGGDFRQATYRAVRQGLMQAQSVLLEPYYAFSITVPRAALGRVMTDVQQMRGRSEPPLLTEETACLKGTAPVIEIRNYAKELAAFTGGHGRILLQFAGYDVCQNAQEVMERKGYDPGHDLSNSPDSVFCGHGTGYIVAWDEVPMHMHVESVLAAQKENVFDTQAFGEQQRRLAQKGQEKPLKFGQEDADLKAIFERTYGPVKDRARQAERTVRTAADKGSQEAQNAQPWKQKMQGGREYLLVDGYNIVFAWEELSALAKDHIDAARGKLMDALCDYQAVRQCTVILVFDAYRVKGNIGQVQQYHNIQVVYTKEAETADQYIEKAAHRLGRSDDVTVATSDGLEQLIVWGQGCRILSARQLKEELERVRQDLREAYLDKPSAALNRIGDVQIPSE